MIKACLIDENSIIITELLLNSIDDNPDSHWLSDSSELKEGDLYTQELAYMGEIPPEPLIIDFTNPASKPNFPLVLLGIDGTQLVGDIYWLQKDSPFILTASVDLPDSELMLIVERVVDATRDVGDIRFKAVISNGVITVSGSFDISGNYIITAERLNRGLERINESFTLSFDKIEFDIYS